MLSIPDIAQEMVDKSLSEQSEDAARTIFFAGSKSVGKTNLINLFLEKTETSRETLVLEYSFGRKSNQKQGIEKIICHVWEYGGKIELLKNVLTFVPVSGKHYFCIMLDLSNTKRIWNTIELCLDAIKECYGDREKRPDVAMICGKYDLFKNYDSEIKKSICTTLRCIALLYNTHLVFYSSKEPHLVKRAKDMLHTIGFGSNVHIKEKSTNYNKPLIIPKDTDSWESIGIAPCTFQQVKIKHTTRFPSDPTVPQNVMKTTAHRSHPEPVIDSLSMLKYEEIRKMDSLDVSMDEYLSCLH